MLEIDSAGISPEGFQQDKSLTRCSSSKPVLMDLLLNRNRQVPLPLRREYGEGSWSIFRIIIRRVEICRRVCRKICREGWEPAREKKSC